MLKRGKKQTVIIEYGYRHILAGYGSNISIFSINNKNCIEICYGIVAEGVSDLKGVEGVAEGVEFV